MTAESARIRRIVTPEGVPLPFEIAGAAERLAAFAIDFLVVHVGIVLALLVAVVAGAAAAGSYAMSAGLLASFLLRNFYFVFSEMRWGGSTIGKRRFGLRVVARDGGALTPEAVFARNFTREVEVFLPLTVLVQPSALLPGLPAWATLLGTVWVGVFALLPFASRDRLRIGDLAGGTLVVRMPEAILEQDLVRRRRPARAKRYRFTDAQLDLYGIHELHVLEEILRKAGQGVPQDEVMAAVAARIKRKIGWTEPSARDDSRAFLEAFYAAQRARLEHKMLFGVRQERKRE
jgi:uncharacterized RDD family membrane protein YckC